MLTLRLVVESFGFAWKALRSNLLRTILSLLGVTIGIFAIIAVLTLVDSLEKNIKDSLNFLGTNVIYVQKWPFVAEGGEFKWWEYWRRPTPSIKEFKFLQANLKNRDAIAIYARKGNSIIKQGSNGIGQITVRGAGEDYDKIYTMDIDEGRYLTLDEIESGRNVAVLGYEVSKALFPNGNSIGGTITIKDIRFKVVGTVKKEGESFIGISSNDYTVIIPYNSIRKIYQTGTGVWNELESSIGIKGSEYDVGLVELENELRGYLRTRRGLKPYQKDNFALNRPEAVANLVSGIFDVFSIAGWVIGGFSMLVGGFGIANIMFVSVKERTGIIGLQKSLGAKNYFILFQFLFESIFLSLIGGLAGLALVYLLTLLPFGSLVVILSVKNIVLGIGVSSVIGIVAGIVPAAMAARLDPVDALRST
jgi:putative ABC transport system permease protein